MRHIESDKPIYIVGMSFSLFIRAHYCARIVCDNSLQARQTTPRCFRQQSHQAGNQIFYAHQFLTRVGERKEKGHTPCRLQLSLS